VDLEGSKWVRRTARADVYMISIVPAAAHLRATRHSGAIEKVRELARGLEVDGWFTCNQTHYARRELPRTLTGTRDGTRWTMLQRGDSVPHFQVTTVGGALFSYSTIWQRQNLVLLCLPAAESQCSGTYMSELVARKSEFGAKDAECVVTRDPVAGVGSPGIIVADRWGEIAHVAQATHVDDLTSPEDLLDWLDYLEQRCPECEGEAK
jgi:hypothetical protein